jgi:hypothetical protein
VVVENSDAITIKPDPTHSTNSFSVPEDYSDIEPEVVMLDSDDSKDSVARSWDTTNLHLEKTSPVSSVSERPAEVAEQVKSEVPEASTNQNNTWPESKSLSQVQLPEFLQQDMNARAAAIAREIEDSQQPVEPQQELPVPEEKISEFHNTKMQTFPPACYQKIIEEEFSDWTMMKPLLMRLADMAWGVSDRIPDVDHVNKIIHSARRCSVAKSSYMVDDSPDFQPWNGTETPWGFNGHEESDTTYHRVPGPALRYWFVDKRRFWILDGDEENDLRTSEWWWIVEKPWELLSEATKAELNAESDVPDHQKCWIIREWKPQWVGGQYYEVTPYWDSNFYEDLPSDDESMDSDEFEEKEEDSNGDGERSIYGRSDASDVSSVLLREGHMELDEFSVPWITPFGHELDEEDDEDDSDYDSGDSNDKGSSEDESEELDFGNEYDEDEDDSESEDEAQNDVCPEEAYIRRLTKFMDVASSIPNFYPGNNYSGSSLPTPTSPPSVRPEATVVQDAKAVKQRPLAPSKPPEVAYSRDVPENASAKETLITPISPEMINPATRFPNSAVSSELPSSCQSTLSQAQLSAFMDQSTHGSSANRPYPLLAPWHPSSKEGMSYSDGPFRSPQKDLKRTASQMESSSNDTGSQSFSQDAQRPQPLEAYSQDTNLNTISSTQLQDAITSALSENASEPPRKRVKATHPTRSKTLASHAATAVVGALLGGLGTIAMLAALPPNYFH